MYFANFDVPNAQKEIDLFVGGNASVSNQVLSPGIAGYDATKPPRIYSIEKAKEALAKAGFPGGKGLPTITVDLEGSSTQRQYGEFFKDEMSKIGIDIKIVLNTRPELFDKKRRGKIQIVIDGWVADYPDAQNYLQLLYSKNKAPGPNYANFENAEFDSLYLKIADMQPGPARSKLIKRVNEIFDEETPWGLIRVDTLSMVTQGWVKNYLYLEPTAQFKYIRIDGDEKKALLKKF
jgi:ABC-type transport system substrate-binding protein